MTEPALKHPFAIWLFAHGYTFTTAAVALDTSRESVSRFCLPYDHKKFRLPNKRVLDRIITLTSSQITGHDFLPPRSRDAGGEDALAAQFERA